MSIDGYPPATESTPVRSGRRPRPVIVALAGAAAVLICSIHAKFAVANTPRDAGIGYLCDSLVLLGCAAAFWSRRRLAQGTIRVRWLLMTAAALAASIGYFPSFTELYLHAAPSRQIATVAFNAGEALYMLAVVLFFAGVARSVVIVDLLQALLFVILRFNLVYSPVTHNFTHFNLIAGQLVALFLFLIALVACLGAASSGERNFLRIISWYFGLRLIAFFTADQVSYVWFGYHNSSLWDVLGSVLLSGFALFLLSSRPLPAAEAPGNTALRSRSVVVRSLMPSFLALVNLMLGLSLLRFSVLLAGAAISMSLVCYVVRTVLLHAQAAEEKAHLESRNEQLEGLAVRDPLTGIGNRRSLAGAYKVLQSTAGGLGLSILLMDIDHFKKVNDCHGHLHGDRVLTALAGKLEDLASGIAGGHCARFGGDEFALLLPGVDPRTAFALAEDLRLSFGAHRVSDNAGSATLSIGVASLPAARDLPLETLVCGADEALYRAKLLGRDRVEIQPLGTAAGDPGHTAPHLELQHSA